MVRGRGGRIDPNTDQGVFAAGAQDIAVFGVNIRDIEPAFRVIVRRGAVGFFQSWGKTDQFQFGCFTGGNMHDEVLLLV